MKSYPSIPSYAKVDAPTKVVAFDKLDGSNVRAEWSRKQGFYKFGSRTRLISEADVPLGKSIGLIMDKYGEVLSDRFQRLKYQSAVSFFEFHGKNSRFGYHQPDDEHCVTLLDVAPYKKGLLPPNEFMENFGDLGIPGVLYSGPLDESLILKVKNNSLPGMTFEGVVCKGQDRNGRIEMVKIKSEAWLTLLKDFCKGDKSLYEQLS